jgi:hypothetical protein
MAKKLALIFGVIFLLVGILGFLGGVGIVGETGIFVTDSTHDWIHVITGLILLIVAFAAPAKSGLVLTILGVVYLIVAILGFFTNPVLGFIHGNTADAVLHLVLGAVLLWGGVKGKGAAAPAPMSMPPQM